MAARTTTRRDPANIDFSNVGKLGRRTGVTLDQRPLDVNGIEEITGIFSSPRKPSPLKNVTVLEQMDEGESVLSARRSVRSTPARLPRSSSPRKSGISGTARKSNGLDVFSARKTDHVYAEEYEDRENTPIPAPSLRMQTPQKMRTSPRTARPTQIQRFSPASDKSNKTTTPTRLSQPRPINRLPQIESEVAHSVEDTADEDFDPYQEVVEEIEAAARDSEFVPSAAQSTPSGPSTRLTTDVSEDLDDPVLDFNDSDGDVERVASESPAPQAEHNQANSRKKRKSDAIETGRQTESPRPTKMPKKRGRPRKGSPDDTSIDQPSVSAASNAKGKQPLRKKDPNLKISNRQQRELDDIVEKVRARPGPPRSLYVLRRETPADDSVAHTRSGRISVKPLAYWRNERCVYADSPRGTKIPDGARFPMNSIKEIVRTEEVVEPLRAKSKGKAKNKAKGKTGKAKARQASAEDDDTSESDFDMDAVPEDPYAEEWETNSGTLKGNVSIWDNGEQAPTEQEEEIEIAHAPAAIKTREVKGTGLQDGPTFRFAKLLSTPFFGTGLVDLAPGGVKRPKNSRKMHMSFFVVKGRVTVSVGPLGGEEHGSASRFSIGKGGFWQVPRGNQYSIENEMEKPARIFFSQGCETGRPEFGLED